MGVHPEKSRRGRQARRKGSQKELRTVDWYRDQGWVAIHNTHGPFDVMAMKAGERGQVTEVKYGKKRYGNFTPEERAKTLAAALQAGADAYLAWWKPQASEPVLIHSSEWPTGQTQQGESNGVHDSRDTAASGSTTQGNT